MVIAGTVSDAGQDGTRALDGQSVDVMLSDDANPRGRRFTQKVPVTAGRATLLVDLPFRPSVAVVDPFIRRLDRERSNNRKLIADSR